MIFHVLEVLDHLWSGQHAKKTTVHLEVANGQLVIHVVVRRAKDFAPKAQGLHYAPHVIGALGVKEHIVVRHLPHARLRILVLEHRTFERTVPYACVF